MVTIGVCSQPVYLTWPLSDHFPRHFLVCLLLTPCPQLCWGGTRLGVEWFSQQQLGLPLWQIFRCCLAVCGEGGGPICCYVFGFSCGAQSVHGGRMSLGPCSLRATRLGGREA